MAVFMSSSDVIELLFINMGSFLLNSWFIAFLKDDVRSAADNVAGVQLHCTVSGSDSSSTLLKWN